jgi:hypothetical protein
MTDGIAGVEEVFSKFRERLSEYLQTMEASDSQEV